MISVSVVLLVVSGVIVLVVCGVCWRRVKREKTAAAVASRELMELVE